MRVPTQWPQQRLYVTLRCGIAATNRWVRVHRSYSILPAVSVHQRPCLYVNRKQITATTTGLGPDRYNVNWNGGDVKVQTLVSHAPDATMIIDGRRISITFHGDDVSDWYIGIEERTFKLAAPKVKRSATQDDNSAYVTAPCTEDFQIF